MAFHFFNLLPVCYHLTFKFVGLYVEEPKQTHKRESNIIYGQHPNLFFTANRNVHCWLNSKQLHGKAMTNAYSAGAPFSYCNPSGVSFVLCDISACFNS